MDGIWIGKWLSDRKKNYKNSKLSKDRIRRLEGIGMKINNSNETIKFSDNSKPILQKKKIVNF